MFPLTRTRIVNKHQRKSYTAHSLRSPGHRAAVAAVVPAAVYHTRQDSCQHCSPIVAAEGSLAVVAESRLVAGNFAAECSTLAPVRCSSTRLVAAPGTWSAGHSSTSEQFAASTEPVESSMAWIALAAFAADIVVPTACALGEASDDSGAADCGRKCCCEQPCDWFAAPACSPEMARQNRHSLLQCRRIEHCRQLSNCLCSLKNIRCLYEGGGGM